MRVWICLCAAALMIAAGCSKTNDGARQDDMTRPMEQQPADTPSTTPSPDQTQPPVSEDVPPPPDQSTEPAPDQTPPPSQ